MMFFVWLVVAILMLIALLYVIGRTAAPDEDIGHMIFMSVMASIGWPLIVGAVLLAAPFCLPYYIGKRNRKKALEKAEMWDKLKK